MSTTQPQTSSSTRPKQPDPPPPKAWNVVLLDDEEHGFDYVIRMLTRLFGHNQKRALELTTAVDKNGRAIVFTTHKELAELKRDQVLGFGRDHSIAECKGSMTAIIEPADFGTDDGEGEGPDDHRPPAKD